ncbi:glycosyltransferase family 4 protein [Amycolatopsis nigrescens]|uniref:glycosyltransferase family 4 protein n=1 Tax=Amycolatopsis nigrescens TaxID=381445 RepID=UPI00037EF750|nr:glycosyltransferase family 4 protein [Amycolatopsis nigrescens]
MASRRHVLIIVQNLPVPLDRRVWLECRALVDAGFEVSVICPKGPDDPPYEWLDEVHLYKYAPPPQAEGVLGYLREFAYCWAQTARLSRKVWRRRPFDVIQACNPPDTYWALARLWAPRGVRFVFDHHDLNPEVYRSRFGEPAGITGKAQLAGLYWLERNTFRTADRVISTNTSYQRIAIERGKVAPERTTVVRSGPDTSVMRPGKPKPELKRGREHLVVWLGIMGPQDGVDGVLEVARRVVHEHGRTDVGFALLGFGDCLEELRGQCTELGLDEHVEFTGRVGAAQISDYLSTASVGLSADPLSPLNDVSTMNKTMEYMAFALPVLAYRLTETVVSAGNCAVYLEPGDVAGFSAALVDLLDDPARRAELGKAGRVRAERELDWAPQSAAYVSVYQELLAAAGVSTVSTVPTVDTVDTPAAGPSRRPSAPRAALAGE